MQYAVQNLIPKKKKVRVFNVRRNFLNQLVSKHLKNLTKKILLQNTLKTVKQIRDWFRSRIDFERVFIYNAPNYFSSISAS